MDSLIEKDNKFFKESIIEMIETDKAEDALYVQGELPTHARGDGLGFKGKTLNYHRGYLTQEYLNSSLGAKSYHLYFLSYEEVQSGDWYRNSIGNICRLGNESWEINHVKGRYC